MRAIRIDRPDPIDLVPRTFMTKHEESRVRRGEEKMVDPIGAMQQDLPLAGLYVHGE